MSEYPNFAEQFAALGVSAALWDSKVCSEQFTQLEPYFQQLVLQNMAKECAVVLKNLHRPEDIERRFGCVFDNQCEILHNERTFLNEIINYLEVDDGINKVLFGSFRNINKQAVFYQELDSTTFLSTTAVTFRQFKKDHPACAQLLYHRMVEKRSYAFISMFMVFLTRDGAAQKASSFTQLFARCRNAFLDKVFTLIRQQP